MRIVILGGTGLVGSYLKPQLERHGHDVKVYGREAFDPGFDLAAELNGLDCLIQLSGANIGQRWTAAHQKRIWTSRVDLNHHLAEVLQSLDEPPKRVIAASAIGFYPESDCDHPLDESHTDAGQNTFGDLVQAWEKATQPLAAPERLVTFRFGVVLAANGGALGKMLPAFKLGLGGPIAGGQQCFSWVHIDDLAQGFLFVLDHPEMHGTFNLTSPQPVSQAEFGRQLAHRLHRPFWLPVFRWQLRLLLGDGAQVLTVSQAVVPTQLTKAGFRFQYPTLDKALENLF